MSSKHTKTDGRLKKFSRNHALEKLLKELNADLSIAENSIISEVENVQKLPLILVMGPMRSGTTLFMQWLANTGLFSYPTNLLSRFYQAPIIGAKIQLLLTDPRYSFLNELSEFSQQSEYLSENGKTQGVLAPNEFWYFWRRFFAEPSRDVWSDVELRQTMNVKSMKAELLGMMDVFQKPFLAKGIIFNYNIPFLNEVLDKVIFVQIQRDIDANVASVLEARKKQFGSENEWYSFKIPEYSQLKNLDSVTQSAGHVHYINKAVTKGMSTVDESRKLIVGYEEFCNDPRSVFDALIDKLGFNYEDSEKKYSGPEKFSVSRNGEIANLDAIRKSLEEFGE